MKFSNEAMRAALLFIEETQKYQGDIEERRLSTFNINMIINNSYFTTLFTKHRYSKDELQYTVEQMISGHILEIVGDTKSYYEITKISFHGIQLLDSIRPETTWEKVKSITSKVGNHTLSFIENTAQQIAVEAAKQAITVLMLGNQ